MESPIQFGTGETRTDKQNYGYHSVEPKCDGVPPKRFESKREVFQTTNLWRQVGTSLGFCLWPSPVKLTTRIFQPWNMHFLSCDSTIQRDVMFRRDCVASQWFNFPRFCSIFHGIKLISQAPCSSDSNSVENSSEILIGWLCTFTGCFYRILYLGQQKDVG